MNLLASVPLKRLASIRPSNVDKHSVDTETAVQLCNYLDVYRNERITDELELMAATGSEAQIERFQLRSNDVIITKDSEDPEDIGVPAYVPQDLPGVVCGYHLTLLRPNREKLHGGFLYWALQSSRVHAYCAATATGITRWALNTADVENIPIAAPDLAGQVRIANFLDEQTARIDALIAEKERLALTLAQWRSAELERICFGSDRATVDTGHNWISALPRSWRLMRLKYLVSGIEQGWSPECEARLVEPDEWGVLKAGASNGGVFRDLEHKALPAGVEPLPEYEVKPGDVLVSRASGSADLVGSFAFVHETRPRLMLSDKNFRLRFTPGAPLLPELLAWMCNTYTLRQQILQFVSGAAGLAKNIGVANLRELWLAVPPAELQPGLVADVRRLNAQYDALGEQIRAHVDRLREYRASLITAAVTGQFAPPRLFDPGAT